MAAEAKTDFKSNGEYAQGYFASLMPEFNLSVVKLLVDSTKLEWNFSKMQRGAALQQATLMAIGAAAEGVMHFGTAAAGAVGLYKEGKLIGEMRTARDAREEEMTRIESDINKEVAMNAPTNRTPHAAESEGDAATSRNSSETDEGNASTTENNPEASEGDPSTAEGNSVASEEDASTADNNPEAMGRNAPTDDRIDEVDLRNALAHHKNVVKPRLIRHRANRAAWHDDKMKELHAKSAGIMNWAYIVRGVDEGLMGTASKLTQSLQQEQRWMEDNAGRNQQNSAQTKGHLIESASAANRVDSFAGYTSMVRG